MRKTDAEKLVKAIRKAYPNPKANDEADTLFGYCVGGAFCCWPNTDVIKAHIFDRLPGEGDLARKLHKYNTALDTDDLFIFETAIFKLNDNKKFKKAWNVLTKALHYKSKKTPVELKC